jgi:hypothetical protein
LGGLILPVWGVIEKALAKQVFFYCVPCYYLLAQAAVSLLYEMLYQEIVDALRIVKCLI